MKKSLSEKSSAEKLLGKKRSGDAKAEDKEPAKKRVKKQEAEEEKKGTEVAPAKEAKAEADGADKGLNQAIAEQIERLLKYYNTSGDKGRSFGYRNALKAIKSIDKPIHSADDLNGTPGLGEGIIKKIREFIADGTIKRFEFIDTDPKTKAI